MYTQNVIFIYSTTPYDLVLHKMNPPNIQIRYEAPHLQNLNNNGKVDTLFFMFHALSFSVLATIISLRYA